MRRLVSSDWQLAHNERDRYRTNWVVNDLPKLVEKYKVEQLVFLGDLTENKDNHPAALVNEIVEFFCGLATNNCDVVILQGNHDFLHKEYPFFRFLQNYKAIKWISSPTEMENCLYLPHTRNYKQDWKDIGFTKQYDFIFAHNIFEGVKANGQALSGIPRNIFPAGSCVISGDVHEPQFLDPITYVGSPCLCDFGDDYQPRVLLLTDLDAKSIKVQGQQKRLIYCAVNKVAGQRELAFDHNANAGDIVKIKVDLLVEDVADWLAIKQEVEDWAAKNKFIVYAILPEVAYVQGARQKLAKNNKRSDSEYLNAFVQRNGTDAQTAEVGKSIIDLI
jgi:DNA repair exonuclease SbcCD nuclease subunit